ncbi:BMP family ABC transporter substrate-binding protein [uncultured Sneathiella sp.]|uniref:BMP family ABC transporter substrate-binding protein n=1 Tax=uncultured Sneathiella sp. TaxID=879315 RepID=UPI002598945A|nr:BMP family ABC transporter substrate-binding protein [uncultured Sneathiella sp.]
MKLHTTLAALFIMATMSAAPASADDKKIGFVYVGPAADYGYNTSMDLGRQYLEKNMKGIDTSTFENIPESAEVEQVMERLIQSGHGIIFATSYGYLDYAISLGKKYPDVKFLHAGGLKTSDNVGTYWADSDHGMYLAGVVAGSKSESGKLGFIGAFQIPQLFRSINAFTLGAQSVNPDATVTVVWTGGWWEPQKEAEATNAFADEGIDVIAEQVDSPITIAQTAEKRGVYIIGKDVNVMDRAPEAWLTGVSWNWGPMMENMVKEIHTDTWTPSHVRSDLAGGAAVLDPFGKSVSEETKAKVLALKDKIVSGEMDIWTGPIIAQDGTEIVGPGIVLGMEEIESMNFLVKGVIGSTN